MRFNSKAVRKGFMIASGVAFCYVGVEMMLIGAVAVARQVRK